MKNKELWVQKSFLKDAKGRIIGTHMHKIIGHAYEKVIKEHCSGQLVDMGCGEVPYYFLYKDLVDDNICIDWGREDGEISFLDIIADLNDPLPLADETANTVLCTDVLEHIRNPELLFSEMARIMKTGGKLVLTVPFLYWVHDAPHDHHRYTGHKLNDFCEKNKLKVITLEAYGGWPEVVYDMVFKGIHQYNFPLKRALLFFWRKTGMSLYKRKRVKNLSHKSRETFPLGYILVAQK